MQSLVRSTTMLAEGQQTGGDENGLSESEAGRSRARSGGWHTLVTVTRG